MPEIGESAEHADIDASSEAAKASWKATLEDMKGMAAELEEEGWTTTVLAADNTAPTISKAGDTDLYGLVSVIPANVADEYTKAFEQGHEEGGGFEEYEVYRSETNGWAFQVTVFYDELTANAILLAANYQLRHAENLMRVAMEREEMYTHIQIPDGTILGSFRHEAWDNFFPNAKQRLNDAE